MNKFKGYIFDLDDTLYREHDYVKSGFLAVARELSKYTNYPAHEIFALIINEWKENGRGKTFNNVCKKFNLNVDITYLVEVYRSHKPQISIYEDAYILIKSLKKDNKKLGIITDGNSTVQWAKIESLGIKDSFDCIIVTDDFGRKYWKPSEIPYRRMVECLNLTFEQCVYIGDNPHKDFISARKLGMATVRIIRSVGDHMNTNLSKEYEADITIRSLAELM